MAAIKFEDRSIHAQGIIALLKNKNTSMQDIISHGWVDDYEMDLSIVKLYLMHPNCPQNIVYRSVKIASQKNTSFLLAVLQLVFEKFPNMNDVLWNNISGQIYAENIERFITAQNKLLLKNNAVNMRQLAVIFRYSTEFGQPGFRHTILFRTHFLCIFDNENFDPAVCFENTPFITGNTNFANYTIILDAIRASKNTSKITSYLFGITNNKEYLSPDARDVFCF